MALDQAAFPNGVYGAAFDHKENLYAASAGSGNEAPLNVGKIHGGCNAKKTKTLTTTNTIAYSGGVRVDKADRIAILVQTNQNAVDIDTYGQQKGGSLGSPVSTTPLTNSGNPQGRLRFAPQVAAFGRRTMALAQSACPQRSE